MQEKVKMENQAFEDKKMLKRMPNYTTEQEEAD